MWELIIDEFGMMASDLLHALSLSPSLERVATEGLDQERYHREPFGRIPICIAQGDFMQLGPVRKHGVVEHHGGDACTLETEDGWKIYKEFQDVVLVEETNRFRDTWLPRLWGAMRASAAKERKIPDDVWAAFKDTWMGAKAWLDGE